MNTEKNEFRNEYEKQYNKLKLWNDARAKIEKDGIDKFFKLKEQFKQSIKANFSKPQ